MFETPFRYLDHLMTVPVMVNGSTEARFVLDTGIGLTLISQSLCRRIDGKPNGATFTGKRMSGQEVTLPLGDGPYIALGGFTRRDVVGLFDMSDFPEALAEIDGFLSLAFFEANPFTVDYERAVVIFETPASLADRAASGTPVPITVEQDGPSVCAFLRLTVPGGRSIDVEVDTGSDSLILNEPLARDVQVQLEHPLVRRVEGRDETGYTYTRYFARLPGAIHVTAAPSISQSDPDVMFQRIIYDGLVGDSFLRNFIVTYDLPAERMIFCCIGPVAGFLDSADPHEHAMSTSSSGCE